MSYPLHLPLQFAKAPPQATLLKPRQRNSCNAQLLSDSLEELYLSGTRKFAIDFLPDLSTAAENEIQSGYVIGEVLEFLARHRDTQVWLTDSTFYERWARRLDCIPDERWFRAVDQAEVLMTHHADTDSGAFKLERAYDSLIEVPYTPACWRVFLRHLEHFYCGEFEMEGTTRYSCPNRDYVKNQLLELYARVEQCPAWGPVIEELHATRTMGEGSIYSVPVLGKLTLATQLAAAFGVVALAVALEPRRRSDPQQDSKTTRLREGVSVAACCLAIPALVVWSAAGKACDTLGKSYTRWKRGRGERLSPRGFKRVW